MAKFEVVNEVEGNKHEQKSIKVWIEQVGNGGFRVMYKKGETINSLIYTDTSYNRLVIYADDCVEIGLDPVIL